MPHASDSTGAARSDPGLCTVMHSYPQGEPAGPEDPNARLGAVQPLIEIILAVVVLAGIGGAFFVRGRQGGRGRGRLPAQEPLRRPIPASASTPTAAPAEVDLGDTTETEPEATETEPEVTEAPEPAAGRLVRLRARLARSESTLGRGLLALLSRDTLDDATWQEVEDLLITADVGVGASNELVASLKAKARVLGTRSAGDARVLLREGLLELVEPDLDRTLATKRDAGEGPAVVLVVGVNGTGKTTTCGKIARLLVAEGRTVVLGAADTFRAAAADQLETWGRRVGAQTVRGPEGGDPASVAFDAVKTAIELDADTVLIDTAGRLHTKAGLMDELGKVKRVVEKQTDVDEVLLVLDATTGQNGLVQARVFAEVVAITGVVLTKLDGTAKGGIVISVQRELGVPVKLIGLGEGADDLAPFEPEAFVDALLGS
jgi:fused signal recognition particle receptor